MKSITGAALSRSGRWLCGQADTGPVGGRTYELNTSGFKRGLHLDQCRRTTWRNSVYRLEALDCSGGYTRLIGQLLSCPAKRISRGTDLDACNHLTSAILSLRVTLKSPTGTT